MDGKTHQFGGICSGIIVGSFLLNTSPLTLSTVALGGCLLIGSSIGSLLPDIDHHNSTIRNKMRLTKKRSTSKGWKAQLKERRRQKREKRLPEGLRHRGITHTPFLAMVIMIGLLLLYPTIPLSIQSYYFMFAVGLFTGILSHIFLDALTVKGVPLLGPITYKKFRLLKLKTNRDEWVASALMIILAGSALYYNVFL